MRPRAAATAARKQSTWTERAAAAKTPAEQLHVAYDRARAAFAKHRPDLLADLAKRIDDFREQHAE